MKSIKIILILVAIVSGILPMAAKDKTQDICRNMLYFDGEVVKDKATKQKIPNGYGKLFINGYDGYNRVDNVSITGDFNCDIVENATFKVND